MNRGCLVVGPGSWIFLAIDCRIKWGDLYYRRLVFFPTVTDNLPIIEWMEFMMEFVVAEWFPSKWGGPFPPQRTLKPRSKNNRGKTGKSFPLSLGISPVQSTQRIRWQVFHQQSCRRFPSFVFFPCAPSDSIEWSSSALAKPHRSSLEWFTADISQLLLVGSGPIK